MKTMIRIMLICLAAVAMVGLIGTAGAEETPKFILYTCYENVFPDGEEVEAGCVDEEGNLWTISEMIPDGDPYLSEDNFLMRLRKAGRMTLAGKLDSDDLFDLKSLIFSVEDQGWNSEAVSEGAGGEYSVAVVYDTDGNAQRILLGMSGDSKFENTDPNAQALYLWLRKTFPDVTCFGGEAGPQGFQAVSLIEYCGWQDIDWEHVVIVGYDIDCEVGSIPFEMSEEDQAEMIQFIRNRKVTGKANATMVTGGTSVYGVTDGEGNWLASLELYRGMLVQRDGMYFLGK